MRNILRKAIRLGGQGRRTYDYVFHSQAAVDSSIDWSELNPALALSYLQQLPSSTHPPCPLCSLCQELDHSSTTCALAPLASPSQQWPQEIPAPLIETLVIKAAQWVAALCLLEPGSLLSPRPSLLSANTSISAVHVVKTTRQEIAATPQRVLFSSVSQNSHPPDPLSTLILACIQP